MILLYMLIVLDYIGIIRHGYCARKSDININNQLRYCVPPPPLHIHCTILHRTVDDYWYGLAYAAPPFTPG